MNMAERLGRRRRLVLGVLHGGPADTATIARRVRGQFYEVHGILADLAIEKLVERDGCLWRLESPRDEHPPGNIDICHKPIIGTGPADLEPVDNPVDSCS